SHRGDPGDRARNFGLSSRRRWRLEAIVSVPSRMVRGWEHRLSPLVSLWEQGVDAANDLCLFRLQMEGLDAPLELMSRVQEPPPQPHDDPVIGHQVLLRLAMAGPIRQAHGEVLG